MFGRFLKMVTSFFTVGAVVAVVFWPGASVVGHVPQWVDGIAPNVGSGAEMAATTAAPGTSARVVAQRANVRRSAGHVGKPTHDIIGQALAGQQLRILAGPQLVDGLTWWYVDGPAATDGWIAQQSVSGMPIIQLETNLAPGAPGWVDGFRYVVQPGDTLAVLANRYWTTVASIMRANGLSSSGIELGTELWIPAAGLQNGAVDSLVGIVDAVDQSARRLYLRTTGNGQWVIQLHSVAAIEYGGGGVAGEFAIAAGQTIEAVGAQAAYGSLVAATIYIIDDVPAAPAPAPAPASAMPEPAESFAAPSSWSSAPLGQQAVTYRVQLADTLNSIARQFNTTPQAIRQLNGMAPWDDTVYAWQELRVR